VPLFKSCQKSFLNQLTEKIKLRIYAPGDAVVTVGEEGDEMFVLNRVRAEPLQLLALARVLGNLGLAGHRF
jgi:hypothetical protein